MELKPEIETSDILLKLCSWPMFIDSLCLFSLTFKPLETICWGGVKLWYLKEELRVALIFRHCA